MFNGKDLCLLDGSINKFAIAVAKRLFVGELVDGIFCDDNDAFIANQERKKAKGIRLQTEKKPLCALRTSILHGNSLFLLSRIEVSDKNTFTSTVLS